MVGAPEFRGEVFRVLYKLTGGVPHLSPDETLAVALPSVSRRDVRLMNLVTDEDMALLNACLTVESECRRDEWAALERLLTLCQFSDGDLSQRVAALPDCAFARAVLDPVRAPVDRPLAALTLDRECAAEILAIDLKRL